MALLLLLSAFFSGTETALFSLSREQVKRLRGQGSHVEKTLELLVVFQIIVLVRNNKMIMIINFGLEVRNTVGPTYNLIIIFLSKVL